MTMKKFMCVVLIGGLAATAYVLGAKAGRGRYRAIRGTAESFWNDPAVKKARKRAAKKFHKEMGKLT
jgi:hypothetical protein